MSKKDRIAIVISIPLLLLGLVALFEEGLGIVILLPLFCYWGYRFINLVFFVLGIISLRLKR